MARRSILRLVISALLLLAAFLPAGVALGQTVIATIPVGNNPQSVAVNALTNRIYVANRDSNDVSVIDGNSNTIVATIPVGSNPAGVDVDPSTNLVYVTNQGSNNVSVISGASNTVIATIQVGTGPLGVAVNPATNRIYVGNGESNNVSVIDGASNTVIATLPFDSTVGNLAVDPETNRIYVITLGFRGVTSVLDGATNNVIATVATGSNAGDIAVNPSTDLFYVTSSMVGAVNVFSQTDNSLVTSITVAGQPAGTFGVAVNEAVNRIYVTSFTPGANHLSVIDGATNSVVDTIDTGGGADVAVNSAIGRVYLTDGSNDSVAVIQDQVALPPITVSAPVSTEGDGIRRVDISITNNTGSEFAQLEIRGEIPEGATLVEASPGQFQIIGNQVVWFNTEGLAPGQTLVGFQYKISGGVGNPLVTVDFIGQTRGSVSTGPSILTRR